MEAILTPTNLQNAQDAVRRNKGCAGIDGRSIAETEQHWQQHLSEIEAKLRMGSYIPTPVMGIKIPKASGGERLLGIPTVQDRIIQQAVQQVLTDKFDRGFSLHSYGYRAGHSAQQAVLMARSYVRAGNRRNIERLAGWTRRHMRKCFWLRWHNKKGRLNALRRLGAKTTHLIVAGSVRGAWRIAKSPALHFVLSNATLKRYGLCVPSELSTA